MAGQFVDGDDLPWRKVEDHSGKIQDDDQNFPTMDVWTVSFTDPKAIKPLQEYTRDRPSLWQRLQHLKLIRKSPAPSGGTLDLGLVPEYDLTGKSNLETVFEVIVGVSSIAPDDLPAGYSAPKQCSVPATPSLTRTQLQMKNEMWPTVFSPHLLPVEIQFTKEDVEAFQRGMKMAVDEARVAAELGELPVAACILPDQYLDVPLVAHDTRKSTHHPLRHAVMNLVRKLADKVLQDSQDPAKTPSSSTSLSQAITGIASTLAETPPRTSSPASREVDTPPLLQNGEGYQLTNRTLFLTHEPCFMCTMALVHSRVKEVVIVYPMIHTGGCGGRALVPELPTINHRFNVWRWKEDQLSVLGISGAGITIPDTVDA